MVHTRYCAPYFKWPCIKHEANMWCLYCMISLCSRTFYFFLSSSVIKCCDHTIQFFSNFFKYSFSNFLLFYLYNIFTIYFLSNFSFLKSLSFVLSNFSCLLTFILSFFLNFAIVFFIFSKSFFFSYISLSIVNFFQYTKYFIVPLIFLLFNIFLLSTS